MSEKTGIQWTNATINYWHGCKKVSPGCKYCYMYRDKEKYGQDGDVLLKTSDRTIKSTYAKLTKPSLIFTCSWSDFFLEEADQWRDEAWQDIKNHPQHTYQVLTKRPERIEVCLPGNFQEYKNVWFGVSIENDDYSNRADWLERLKRKYPDQVVFISFEPLIGEISYRWQFDWIDWIIIGGESGNETGKYKYRPCKVLWIEQIINMFPKEKIFVKQLGTYLAKQLKLKNHHGGDITEFPEQLRIREYPQ